MLTPNNNGKIEIDISAKEKHAINVDLVEDSFEVDAIPSSEQKQINLDNYLSLDNEKPYTPTGDYNPSTKKYIDDIIKNFKSLNIEKVNTLEEVTDAQTIYLIPSLLVDGTNYYEEYILVDGKPECLGITKAEMAKKQNRLIEGENVSIVDDVISAKGGVEPKRGEELALMEEPFSGVAFCTEGYGEEFLEGSMYEYEDGVLIKTIELSGGGSGNTNQSETITPLEANVAVGNPVLLEYEFKSKSSGKGTAKLFINGTLKSSKIITKGINSFDITEFVKEGSNFFTVTITDSSNSTVTFDYIINGVKLTLKTTFNESYVYTGDVTYTYTVIGAGTKTLTFILDDEELDSFDVRSSGEQAKYIITGLTHGAHLLKVLATTVVSGITIESNELMSQILYAEDGVMTPIVSSSFSKTEAIEGELLAIDYIIYDPAGTTATAYLQVNDETPIEILVDRTKHYWNIAKYPIGEVTFRIGCGDISVEKVVMVEKLEMDIEPVEDDLILYLSAANRSNAELDGVREVWSYKDISCELQNLNWVSNGWMNNTLKLTGEATGYIPLEIFGSDPKIAGRTIEIEFATHNITNYSNVLLSCFTENKGIQITATEAMLKSEQEEVKVRFKEDEKVRVSFVVEASNDNRLIRTYVNGILSGIAQYDASDNFQQGAPVGITLNEGKEEIDIYTIRVYDIALSSRQILNNYICDLTDISEKIAEYQANNVYDLYGSISMAKIKSMIPILTITGELPPVKGTKKTVSTTYEDPLNPSLNFNTDNCTIDIQGTSSQYYPKKNYKIKFPEAFSFYEGAVPEKEYTFKADYMESSHSHNTGNAILVNSLYEEMFPTQTADNGVRNTIYGFPCAIYYRINAASEYEYFGAYNFNNDKGNSNTLGLIGPKAQSWEFKNNTSTHCLLRNDDFTPEGKPEDDFEARYPDKYKDYTDLQKVVSWIVSTDGDLEKFKREFLQHFNLHYCLIYYVMMEWGLMMDSRAKNMFFDTIDGNIWYPRMYDMDTCYGLNNEGVLNFGYGLEQHDPDIYNGENSLFWNNFEECYQQEIKDMYLSLRASGKLSYDNMMMIFKENQMDKICEAQYNEDAKFKYLNPVTEDNDTTYLYAAQGNRLSHFQWWVSNRIKYLDSKYETPEYLSDFITMRMYTDQGTFTITPYIDQYLKIKYGSADVKVRGNAGVATLVPCPTGLTFNDTETIIYGANGISEIGDLSNKYPGTVDVSKGLKLSALKIGSSASGYENTHLTTLTLGNNKLLRSIDVSNCPNLEGNLNVEGCTALREFKATGSGLKGITFVDGGDLEILELPITLTNLTIKNHANLVSVKPSKFDDLQTLILKNSKLNASELLGLNFRSLTRLYCTFTEESNTELSIYVMNHLLENCNGVDDNGLNTEYPNIQGYITVTYPSTTTTDVLEELKERYHKAFPYLTITYKSVPIYFSYNKNNNRVEFPTLSANLPAMTLIPNREDVEAALGLAKGTINEDTTFYISNTSSSTYKNTLEYLVIPENYKSYYINMDYFNSLRSIVWPKTPISLTYFSIITSGGTWNTSEIDFSPENIDLSSATRLLMRVAPPFTRLSLKGKHFNKSTGNEAGQFGQTISGYYYQWSGSPSYYPMIEEINMDDILVDSTATHFGYLGSTNYTSYPMSHNPFVLNARGMRLNKMTTINLDGLGWAKTIDISNTTAPEAKVLRFRGYFNGKNSNTALLEDTTEPVSTRKTETIKLNNLDVPRLTSLKEMFALNTKLNKIEWDSFDTGNITDMNKMFYYCNELTTEGVSLNQLSTKNVTDMRGMFSKCSNLELTNLPNFDTKLVVDMGYMFNEATKIVNLDLNNFETPELVKVDHMFKGNPFLENVNMSNMDFSKVTTFKNMFNGDFNLNNLNMKINLASAQDVSGMFKDCSSLTEIVLENKDAPNLTDMSYMFSGCSNIEDLDLSMLIGENVSNISGLFQGCNGLKTLNMNKFLGSKVTNSSYLFEKCKNLTSIDLGLNSKLITMNNMFNDCSELVDLKIKNLDTTSATNMSYAFANNPKLENLEVGDNFSTASATNLSYMFYNSPKVNLPLDKINTVSATSIAGMFKNHKITQEQMDVIKNFNTSKVTNMNELFNGSIDAEEFDIRGLDMTAVTSASGMFSNNPNLKYVNVDGVTANKLGHAFMESLVNSGLERVDFSKNDTIMSYHRSVSGSPQTLYLFENFTNLKELIIPNASWSITGPAEIFKQSPLEVFKLGAMYGKNYGSYSSFSNSSLFKNRTQLRDVYLGYINCSKCGGLNSLFYGCSNLETWDLNNLDTSLNTSLYGTFYGCKKLVDIDLSWMKTNSVTSMAYLFNGCSSLKNINLEGFNYEQVTTIAYMFSNCSSLEEYDLNIPNAPLLTTITYLFSGCSSLKNINLRNADFKVATSMSYFFNGCSSLTRLDLSYLNIPKVTSYSYMFNNCSSLEELDLSCIDKSSNVNISYMFQNCLALKKLDIRNWSINKVSSSSNYTGMFTNVPASCQIIVKDEACRTWIKARKSTFTNIVLASELEG